MPSTGKRFGSWTVRLALDGTLTAGFAVAAAVGAAAAAGAEVAAGAAGGLVGLAGAAVGFAGAAVGGVLAAGAHAWSSATPPMATPAVARRRNRRRSTVIECII
jgi:hypothetical protein